MSSPRRPALQETHVPALEAFRQNGSRLGQVAPLLFLRAPVGRTEAAAVMIFGASTRRQQKNLAGQGLDIISAAHARPCHPQAPARHVPQASFTRCPKSLVRLRLSSRLHPCRARLLAPWRPRSRPPTQESCLRCTPARAALRCPALRPRRRTRSPVDAKGKTR
eukprot:scaffold77_cov236-Pinguiococcus_pyrenoidosus.AAC.3